MGAEPEIQTDLPARAAFGKWRHEDAEFTVDYRAALKTARDGDPIQIARERYQSGQPGGLGIMMMVRGSDVVEFTRSGSEVCLTKCPAEMFASQTIFGDLEFDDLGPTPEELAEERLGRDDRR